MRSLPQKSLRAKNRNLETYFPNCNDPEYKKAEWSFVWSNVYGKKYEEYLDRAFKERQLFLQDPNIPSLYKASPAHYYEIRIIKCLERLSDGTTKYCDDVVPIILEVVRTYGMDAIRLSGLNAFKVNGKRKIIKHVEKTLHPLARRAERAKRVELTNLHRVGGFVCGVIRSGKSKRCAGILRKDATLRSGSKIPSTVSFQAPWVDVKIHSRQ